MRRQRLAYRWQQWAATLLAAVCTLEAVQAAEPSPDPRSLEIRPVDLQRARALVRQLGSDDYLEREQAQAELARMGRLARPALQEALANHPDPEIRHRCATLLPAAIDDDLKARLAVFLADTAGRYDHHLPGWDRFRTAACNEWRWCGWLLRSDRQLLPAARQLYAEMLGSASSRDLLFALDDPTAQLTALAAERRQELILARFPRNIVINGQSVATHVSRPITLADWITLVLIELHLPNAGSNPRLPQFTSAMVGSPLSVNLRQQDDRGQVVRNLIAQWCLSRRDPQELYYLLNNLPNLNLSSLAQPLAQRLLLHPAAPTGYKRLALQRLVAETQPGQLLPVLESLFHDQSVLTNTVLVRVVNGQQQRDAITIELRDAALAIAIYLCDRNPTDYGFVDRMPQQGRNGNTNLLPDRYYFRDDATRQQAFQRWQRERPAPPNP